MSLQWYRTGTVDVTNGSATVAGTGTNWKDIGQIKAGDMFSLDGSQFYEIDADVSVNTSLTLKSNYAGTTQSAQAYLIVRITGASLSNADLASRVAALLTKWQDREDELLAWQGGTVSGGPSSNGTYPLTDALGETSNVKCPAQQIQDMQDQVDALEEVWDNLPSRAEFEALAAGRRDRYAGSGFVEWGGDNGTADVVAAGLVTKPIASYANTLVLGTEQADTVGDQTVNVAGYALTPVRINDVSTYRNGAITLPPAPADTSLLDRQDLVFLEVWHEKVTDKDFVYPYGNVQYGATSYKTPQGTSLACTNGTFTGYDTYSLFGNWQSSEDLVGKGIVWSTMTDAQKREFISDPQNNLYLDGADVIQVRYRIRVVEGLGSDWENINPSVSAGSQIMQYEQANSYVQAKGKVVSLVADIADTAAPAVFYSSHHSTMTPAAGTGYYQAGASSTLSTTIAHQGLCYALPIALVQRRTSGAFHPVYNPSGSAKCLNVDGTTAKNWYETDRTYTSAADCFSFKSGGDIASGVSGRPDGLYYDEVNERDVKDLRNSAHKVLDLNRCLTREFNRLVAGGTRGWEKQSTLQLVRGPASINGNSFRVSTGVSTTMLGVDTEVDIGGYQQGFPAGTQSRPFYWVYNHTTAEGKYCQLFDNYGRIVSIPSTTWVSESDDISIYALAGNFIAGANLNTEVSAATVLHCDILGDPANYPAAWVTSGFAGTPLLVGENGEDLIPDGTTKLYKMSRKVEDVKLCLKSTNGGSTWTTFTSWDTALEGSANAYSTSAPSTGDLYLFFYETSASPFELAGNAEVLSLGDVWAGNRHDAGRGAVTVSQLIGKVPDDTVGPNYLNYPVASYGILPPNEQLVEAADYYPNHAAIALGGSGPTSKILPYLTRENGQLFLQALFKEMIFDVDWGDDSVFDVVDNISTTTDDNANTVLIGQKRLALPFFIGEGE